MLDEQVVSFHTLLNGAMQTRSQILIACFREDIG